jgi:hypothetical protein
MKIQKILLAAGFLLVVTILYTCKKDSNSSAFDKSYSAWLSYKSSVNNTYSYTAFHDSDSSNFWETKITIKQGSITARDYLQYDFIYTPANKTTTKTLIKEWHETAAEGTIGTHGSDGWGLFTLDDVYYKAQNIWLTAKPGTNTITFETNNNGLISAAGYTPKNCQSGDCFIGVKIRSITN